MKKILFATTALLAAGTFASSAQASDPIKLKVGGYMEYWVAAADQSDELPTNTNSVDVQSDAEIFFTGKTTLDNGMTVGVDVQLEASHTADTDTIDEAYMYLMGKYGRLNIGAENSAAYLMSVVAPSVSPLAAAGKESDLQRVVLTNSSSATGVRELEVLNITATGDAPKLTYFTPKMYGLQAGVSYIPSGDSDGDENQSDMTRVTTWDEAWSFALKYSDKFSGVGVTAGVNYELVDSSNVTSEDNEVESLQAGLNVSYMGFTVGGGYRQMDSEDTNWAYQDGDSWNVGASYKNGPYGVSLTYWDSETDGDTLNNSKEDTIQVFQLSGTYMLGAGVTLFGDVFTLDAENEGDEYNDDAVGGALGLKLKF